MDPDYDLFYQEMDDKLEEEYWAEYAAPMEDENAEIEP